MAEKLLGIGEAAEYLGISISSLRRWTTDGHVRVLRLPGGTRRYERAELDRFRESWRQDPAQPDAEA